MAMHLPTVRAQTAFWQYVNKHRLDEVSSHPILFTALDGGTVRGSLPHITELLRCFTTDVSNKQRLTLQQMVPWDWGPCLSVEIDIAWVRQSATSPFPYDLVKDTKAELRQVTLQYVHRVAKAVRQQVGVYFRTDLSCSILYSPVRVKDKQMDKMGIHIIFWDKIVNKEMYDQVQYHLEIHLRDEFPHVLVDNVGTKDSVHMRLPYAHKVQECQVCDNVVGVKHQCTHCQGLGKVLDPYVYQLVAMWDHQGQSMTLPSSSWERIVRSQLASFGKPLCKDFVIPSHMTSVLNVSRRRAGQKRVREVQDVVQPDPDMHPLLLKTLALSQSASDATGAGGGVTTASRHQENVTVEYKAYLPAIKAIVCKDYPAYREAVFSILVTNSQKNKKSVLGKGPTSFIIHLEGRGSTFCRLQKRSHKSNRVFFLLQWNQRLQRAHLVFKCYDPICRKALSQVTETTDSHLKYTLQDGEAAVFFPDYTKLEAVRRAVRKVNQVDLTRAIAAQVSDQDLLS